MTASIAIALIMGMMTLLFQFFILRISGEKQRCEGRIILLLEKMVDEDLRQKQTLGATVEQLFKEKTSDFIVRKSTVKDSTTPGQRTMLDILHVLEKRRAYLEKLVLSLFMMTTLAVLILFYVAANLL